ncbi:MAG: hypothetical protein P4L93_07235 [Coriobacteriia bacterium]|nr:hypothetical protein [Coriobacteriia bacterium]
MCETGVNVGQLKLAIGQSDDAIAVVQQWLEQLHHLADHGKRAEVSTALAQAGVLLADARGRLDAAIADLEGNSSGTETTVELV